VNPLKPLLEELLALSDLKQMDYGSDEDPFANVRAVEEIGIEPWIGVVARMGDKWKRIQRFTRKRKLHNESFEDALKDMAVYSVICLKLYREEAQSERGTGPHRVSEGHYQEGHA
jgi:hypothetical protein